jgi:homoserine dehydrogenase
VTKSIRIGVAGLGTVGGGVAEILTRNADLLNARTGARLELAAVSARDRARARPVDLSHVAWHENATALAADPTLDVIVETIGGDNGIAHALVEAALKAGKSVVTANKALIARHGAALAALAEENGAALRFEAAVAGGIPVIEALRSNFAANRITRAYGILNGTCNYILSQMEETGQSFDAVLAEAQELGYAEADPTFDVDGIDAGHKLAILAAIAFGVRPNFDAMHVEGIRSLSATELKYADELGCRIKLLAFTSRTEEGIELRVHPAMVPKANPIAQISGALNGITVEGDFVGRCVLEGPGAGAGPTASAVVGDIVAIARGDRSPAFGIPAGELKELPVISMEQHKGAYYLRLPVIDQPGVLADISAILRDEGVSIESLLQHGRDPGEEVSVVITTHDVEEGRMRRVLAKVDQLDTVVAPPVLVRIEQF